jgi:DNA-binding IclR family transcriptional regulator
MLQTVQRATQVLRLFTPEQPEWGVTEVAALLGIPKSGAHLLLSTLAAEGLLQRTPGSRYRLGWSLFELSQTKLETTEFLLVARRVMEQLVAGWGETAHLAVLVDGQVLYVEKLQGDRAFEIVLSRVGKRLPAHCSGVGKVLLAHRSWEEVLAIVERQGLPALTPNTITAIDRLRAELDEVRQRGYAFDQEEVMVGLCCAAAPIRDESGEVVAAMSLSVPAYRFYPYRQRLTTAIVEAARRVSTQLGYEGEETRWHERTRSRSRSSARAISGRT